MIHLRRYVGPAFAGLIVTLPVHASSVFVNEFHYDNEGTDSGEAIEIAGPAGTDLTGWTLELYNGSSSVRAPYGTVDLSGALPDRCDGLGVQVVDFPSNGIQNGAPDGIALIDDSGAVMQFISYEGSFEALGGTAVGLTSVDIAVAETSSTPVGASLQLTGTGQTSEDFSWTGPTNSSFGQCNTDQVFGEPQEPPVLGECGDPAELISAIQGSGQTSPLVGQAVEIEGIVVGDFEGSDRLGGFFVQEEDTDQDGDSATSEGIFVATSASDQVNIGDRVRVAGQVAESFDLTQLINVSSVRQCEAASSATPATISLPLTDVSDLERYEGMRVVVEQTLVITENFNLGRFGELDLATERLMQPTQVVGPGPAALALADANALKRLLLDDGSTDQNPDPIVYPTPTGLSAFTTARVGDTVSGLEGVLSYGFGRYRLQPTVEPVFSSTNARSGAPEKGEEHLRVVGFNVLNYFNGDGAGGGFPTARGADSVSEFERQSDKIVSAIIELEADVLGLIELENDGYGPQSAIAGLVDRLNAVAGGDTYAFVDPGVSQIGTDQITVGLIYRPGTVTPTGASAILDGTVDPRFVDTKNRPVLAQTFESVENGERLTVAVNHLKSKGSDCDDLGDPDTGDGQGNCNLTRTAAAQAQVDWLATDPTGSGDSDVLIIGDLNAYAKEDPVDAIVTGGYVNLIEQSLGDSAYSYIFMGQSGSLDHALATPSLAGQVHAATEWHINADEPRVLDYNEEFLSPGQVGSLYNADPYRASDHDPLIVDLALGGSVSFCDVNGDQATDERDLAFIFVAYWLERSGYPWPIGAADLNDDGRVNFRDVRLWLSDCAESL